MTDKHPDDSSMPEQGPEDYLSDEEIERALAGFEREFQDGGSGDFQDGTSSGDDIDSLLADNFDEELEGLIGNRAKCALIVTRLASAELLSAFCQISDISAVCIDAAEGAVAVLKNLNGDGPEAAVKDLTTVVSGLSAMLIVNRADQLEAKLWIEGQSGQSFPPPMVFAAAADFVEDLLIGTSDLDLLAEQGLNTFDSSDLNRSKALKIIADHTRFDRGNNMSGRIE